MESAKIRELVEKYWEGDTTLEEEEQLRDYFSREEAPEGLKNEATLFRYYRSNTRFRTLDAQFDDQLVQRIERKQSRQRWLVFRPMMSAAAVVVLLLAAVILFKTKTESPAPAIATTEDTYEDPRLAYEQTKEALLLVSSLMNEGTQHIEKLETFSEAQETVKTQIP